MKKLNNAYTLAEVMVTLVILGVLAAVLIPIVKNMYPDKNKVLFRKGYYVTERMVYDLVNDEDLYPSTEGKSGLDNTVSVTYMGLTMGNADTSTTEAKSKFCMLFASKVNIVDIENIHCDGEHITPFNPSGAYVEPSFTTADGIAFYMPYSSEFPKDDTNLPNLYIDVNGAQAPNCQYDSENCPNPDIFGLYVFVDGRIKIKDEIAKKYLKENSSVKSGN